MLKRHGNNKVKWWGDGEIQIRSGARPMQTMYENTKVKLVTLSGVFIFKTKK